jgi:hypothetical protein
MVEDQMILFHGTSEQSLPMILKEGLSPGSCVSDDYQLAEYYAENFDDPVVVQLTVKASCLVADLPAIEEPIRQGESSDRYCQADDFEQAVWKAADDLCRQKNITGWNQLTGMDCLSLVNSARTTVISKCFLAE